MYKYQRVTTPGPNGATLYFKNTEANDCLEVAAVDGWNYVHVPNPENLPSQPDGIAWQEVTLTADDKTALRAVSRPCQLISDEMQAKIRERYKAEDEQYFARIAGNAALGIYQFKAGEQDKLSAYNAYVEDLREWARAERAKIGL